MFWPGWDETLRSTRLGQLSKAFMSMTSRPSGSVTVDRFGHPENPPTCVTGRPSIALGTSKLSVMQ